MHRSHISNAKKKKKKVVLLVFTKHAPIAKVARSFPQPIAKLIFMYYPALMVSEY